MKIKISAKFILKYRPDIKTSLINYPNLSVVAANEVKQQSKVRATDSWVASSLRSSQSSIF
ncbi:MAG: hypothetical protein P4L79_15785 [Legionella sp.]|uniref:hypothetical protein n=1 Tax=Legionella sp. TaxID=459 RepID=UPI00284122A8|nr:hypothetical protein [Legionella sp.]